MNPVVLQPRGEYYSVVFAKGKELYGHFFCLFSSRDEKKNNIELAYPFLSFGRKKEKKMMASVVNKKKNWLYFFIRTM